MVFAVTSEHAGILRRLFSSHSGKIYSFSEYFVKKSIYMPDNGTAAHMPDVPDPFGQHSEVYVETARFLYDAIEAMWKSMVDDLGIEEID